VLRRAFSFFRSFAQRPLQRLRKKRRRPCPISIFPTRTRWLLRRTCLRFGPCLWARRKTCPRLTALGAKLQSIYEDKKKGKEARSTTRGEAGKEERGEGHEGEESKGLEGKGQEGEEGEEETGQKGQVSIGQEGDDGQGKEGEEDRAGNAQGGKKKVAVALAAKAPGKVDKNGRPMKVGGTVVCHASKLKDKYNKRKAKVERLNSTVAVIAMLEGLAQGEKRKVDCNSIEVCALQKKSYSQMAPPPASMRQPLCGHRRRAPQRLTLIALECLAT